MELQIIQSKIYGIRGQKVMLDFDLAGLYQVETRVLNQAVKEEQQTISYGSYVPVEYGRMGNLEVTNCDIKLGRYP